MGAIAAALNSTPSSGATQPDRFGGPAISCFAHADRSLLCTELAWRLHMRRNSVVGVIVIVLLTAIVAPRAEASDADWWGRKLPNIPT